MINLLNARWPQRLLNQNWPIVALVVGIGLFGSVTLYSAAGGNLSPWALNHALRLGVFTGLMLLLSLVPPQSSFRFTGLSCLRWSPSNWWAVWGAGRSGGLNLA